MTLKLLEIVKKNFKILIRSKSSALIIIFGPLLLILLVGTAFNTASFYNIKVASYSPSYNELTNSIISKLEDDQYKISKIATQEECEHNVKIGISHICIVFPADLEVKNDAKNTIEVFVDQSRVNLVYAIKSAVISKVGSRSKELSESLTTIIIQQLEDASKSLQEKKQSLQTLRDSTGEMGSKINTLSSKLEEVDSSLNASGDDISQLMNETERIKEKANISSSVFKNFDNLVDLLKTEINLLNSASSDLKNNVGFLRTGIVTYTDKIREVEATTDKIIENINAIEVTDVESIVSPIQTITRPITTEKTHINYLFPTLIMMIVMFVSLLLSAVTVIREKLSQAYFRNFISPTGGFLFVFSTYLTNIIIIIMQLVIVFGVMLALQPSMANILLNVSLAILLITTVFILLGMIVGYLFSSEETATVGAISLGTILLFFSNTIIPLETLPILIKKITDYNIFVISDTILRKLILFEVTLDEVLPQFYLLLAYAAIFAIGIAVIYRFSTEIYNIKRHLRGR